MLFLYVDCTITPLPDCGTISVTAGVWAYNTFRSCIWEPLAPLVLVDIVWRAANHQSQYLSVVSCEIVPLFPVRRNSANCRSNPQIVFCWLWICVAFLSTPLTMFCGFSKLTCPYGILLHVDRNDGVMKSRFIEVLVIRDIQQWICWFTVSYEKWVYRFYIWENWRYHFFAPFFNVFGDWTFALLMYITSNAKTKSVPKTTGTAGSHGGASSSCEDSKAHCGPKITETIPPKYQGRLLVLISL